MDNVRAILKNWDYTSDGCLTGIIFNDSWHINSDGSTIELFAIRKITDNGKYVHTSNAIYELDPPVAMGGFYSSPNRMGGFIPPIGSNNIDILSWKSDG